MGRWEKLRPGWLAVGVVIIVAGLTAVPAGLKAAHHPGPRWLVAGLVAAVGVLVTVGAPLAKAASELWVGRFKRRAEQAEKARAAREGLPAIADRLPTVAEVTDRGLWNIHQAIPLPAGTAAEGLSAELPEYVTRDVDADLRTYLRARSASGGFALLVGPAAAGKTRTAYEAVRQVLPDWNLLMPATGEEINTLLADGGIPPRSVLWLNETQDFLTGTQPLTATTMRRLLTDTTRPVIAIGTMWLEHYDRLRALTPASPAESDIAQPGAPDTDAALASPQGQHSAAEVSTGVPDFGRSSRVVLELACTFRLAGFSEAEWTRTVQLAERDPRLRHAAIHRASGLAPTQVLSAAPELIARWELADDPCGNALITAAVTARRCGHPPTLPAALLQALTPRFLTGAQRATTAAEDWFTSAIAWASRPVHHSTNIAPLAPHAETIGQLDGYRVSDILTNHPTSTTAPEHQPKAFWRQLVQLASTDACLDIGLTAYRAGRTSSAHTAWQRAAETGDTGAMTGLGILAGQRGDFDSACLWWTRAAEGGENAAMFNLGTLLEGRGDFDGACLWWTRAAEGDNIDAMFSLGTLLEGRGDFDGACLWWTRAAEGGDVAAMCQLGVQLGLRGDFDGACLWWARAAEGGDVVAMCNLSIHMDRQGDIDGARTWYTRAAEADNAGVMANLGALVEEQGADGADSWWTRVTRADSTGEPS